MTPAELRTALALSAIFFFRMLGLFMVLPVLALYVDHLQGATKLLIGLALGVYGLTQATLQIPMGRWSDRIGRKPVISIGLAIFACGGLVAASMSHIWAVIVGRALQGAGAVSGATLALAADLTRAEQRTKTMAIIGITIGAAFSIAFLVGPVLDAWFGLRGVFLAGAGLGIASLVLLWLVVPAAPAMLLAADPGVAVTLTPARRLELRSLYVGVFCLHMVLAASFVSIPIVLANELGIPKGQHFSVYLPVLGLSLLLVLPLIGMSHRERSNRLLFPSAIVCLGSAELALWLLPAQKLLIGGALTLFFVGFNFLEASLPSRISRVAPSTGKGAALGIYSTGQFVGTFIGGVGGGTVAALVGTRGVFAAASVVTFGWLVHTLMTSLRAESGEGQ